MSHRPSDIEVLIVEAIDRRVGLVNTCLPAIVESFNSDKCTVDVKLAIQRLDADGKAVDMPKLVNIPVQYPRSNKCGVYFPLSQGDAVTVFFIQSDASEYIDGGNILPPSSARRYSLSDGFAVPGDINVSNTPKVADKKAISVFTEKSYVSITDDETILSCGMEVSITKDSVKIGDAVEIFAQDQR